MPLCSLLWLSPLPPAKTHKTHATHTDVFSALGVYPGFTPKELPAVLGLEGEMGRGSEGGPGGLGGWGDGAGYRVRAEGTWGVASGAFVG